jgi:hypothetical protein
VSVGFGERGQDGLEIVVGKDVEFAGSSLGEGVWRDEKQAVN